MVLVTSHLCIIQSIIEPNYNKNEVSSSHKISKNDKLLRNYFLLMDIVEVHYVEKVLMWNREIYHPTSHDKLHFELKCFFFFFVNLTLTPLIGFLSFHS